MQHRWPFVVAAVVGLILFLSLQPVRQLTETPPQQFQAVRLAPGMDQQRWSNLYWERGRFVQWHYSSGKRLPEQPVEEFHVSEERSLEQSIAEQTRRAYWKQLQQVWLTSDAWNVSYGLDFSWASRGVVKAVDGALDFVKGLWRPARS